MSYVSTCVAPGLFSPPSASKTRPAVAMSTFSQRLATTHWNCGSCLLFMKTSSIKFNQCLQIVKILVETSHLSINVTHLIVMVSGRRRLCPCPAHRRKRHVGGRIRHEGAGSAGDTSTGLTGLLEPKWIRTITGHDMFISFLNEVGRRPVSEIQDKPQVTGESPDNYRLTNYLSHFEKKSAEVWLQKHKTRIS